MTDRTAPVVALVPTRSPGAGKSRLAPALDAAGRAALGRAMLADVVGALESSPVDRVVVAAAGRRAAEAAAALGVEVLHDPPDAGGLDEAVAAAVRRLPGGAHVLVVMADLPCLTAADVASVLAADGDVVVAPTEDGGTGGLLRRPVELMGTAYGPGSGARHVRSARSAGHPTEVLHLPGFARDVDTWDDLERLEPADTGPCTARFLADLGDRRSGRDGTAG